MILSKTPLRMSYVGGGSDISTFYRDEIGAVLSTSVDKYIYVGVNKKFDGRIRLSYSKTEEVENLADISHPLVRESLKLLNISGGIEITTMADIPSKGSGLGSSSSFVVGLLNALYAYKNEYVSKETLARQACQIEIEKCKEPIGKQDQYAASYGGLNLIKFHNNESVSIDPVICSSEVLNQIEKSTLIFYTGRTRSASVILEQQTKNLLNINTKNLVRRMVELAFELKVEIELGSLDNFGAILNENWHLKKQLAGGVSDIQIDDWYNRGLKAGADGGKLLGAGNGGFLMFFAPNDKHQSIKLELKELRPIQFGFDNNGAQIIFYQPN